LTASKYTTNNDNNTNNITITYYLIYARSGTDWLKEVPWGLRKLLNWVRIQYGNPPVIVTENGVSDDADHIGQVADQQRIRFYQGYINNALKGI